MFSWRAEMIAARSRAFMLGSGWPILAATVISRASLLNSFDFWASCRPLRCMIFLNWECPAMRGVSGFARVVWVERRCVIGAKPYEIKDMPAFLAGRKWLLLGYEAIV